MNRQHATPVWISARGAQSALVPVDIAAGEIAELTIQKIIFDHPTTLPIRDIDGQFADAVPVCMELGTTAGYVDALMVTPSGLPVIIECKLWRNAQARREVVGQIIDYAKEFSRWSAADLDREVAKRCEGRTVAEIVRAAGHDINEIEFADELTRNLRRGRFLLLLVGDGIREGVEAIAEYVQAHAGLHFILGLVELPAFRMPCGGLLFAPRVVARTTLISRTVIALPDGHIVSEDVSEGSASALEPQFNDRVPFWAAYLKEFQLDDPEQRMPRGGNQGWVSFTMPAPGASCWITVYRSVANGVVGLYLSYTSDTVGERAAMRVIDDFDLYRDELGAEANSKRATDGRRHVAAVRGGVDFNDPVSVGEAIGWLRTNTNRFVNVFRPRIRSAVAEFSEGVQ